MQVDCLPPEALGLASPSLFTTLSPIYCFGWTPCHVKLTSVLAICATGFSHLHGSYLNEWSPKQ